MAPEWTVHKSLTHSKVTASKPNFGAHVFGLDGILIGLGLRLCSYFIKIAVFLRNLDLKIYKWKISSFAALPNVITSWQTEYIIFVCFSSILYLSVLIFIINIRTSAAGLFLTNANCGVPIFLWAGWLRPAN